MGGGRLLQWEGALTMQSESISKFRQPKGFSRERKGSTGYGGMK